MVLAMVLWRNGRRARFKIWCPKGRVGSTPTRTTTVKSDGWMDLEEKEF